MMQKYIKSFFAISVVFLLSVAAIFAQKTDLKIVTETTKITAEELKSLAKPIGKKPVLINFWATWCGPCRSEFPELVEIDADYRAKGLNFFLVSVDDIAIIDTRVPEFLKDYESTMPSYLINIEERKEIARAIRRIAPRFADTYPLTLLFDGRGRLVFQKMGRVDAKILRKEIDKVLPKINSQVSETINTVNDAASKFSNKTEIKDKEISIQLTPFGYISLPKGYWAFMDFDMMDAWGGVIETLNGSFKIRFSDGIIEPFLEDKDKNFRWKKQIDMGNGVLIYALKSGEKSNNLLAKIGSANFSAQIKDDSEIETFLEIMKRYRRGKCDSCFDSRITKKLKKIFERN